MRNNVPKFTLESLDPNAHQQSQLSLKIGELWDAQPTRNPISKKGLQQLAHARQALRAGEAQQARDHLQDLFTPEALNLSGVAHEMLGNHETARSLYREALAQDKELFAAQLNLRRSYELWNFGTSQIPFAL